MRTCFVVSLFLTCLGAISVHAQTIELLHSDNKTSLRGLSAVSDKIIWVSGNNGTVGKSTDGGKSWKWITVQGFEKRDFRDIEAFDAYTAVIMAVDAPAYILRTVDGGQTWKLVFENNTRGMFLDAMEFWNEQSGIVIGDPVNGRFYIARTFDGGRTWSPIPFDKLPVADAGEACFAASGTNIRSLDRDEACFVTGGTKSRFFWKGNPVELPFTQGTASAGANSIAVRDRLKLKGSKYLVVVGGDYLKNTDQTKNCFITTDGGTTWQAPVTPPKGYRSAVEFIDKTKLLTCGTSGVDFSNDGGMNWKLVSGESYHVCRKAKQGKTVFLAGANGKISKLVQ